MGDRVGREEEDKEGVGEERKGRERGKKRTREWRKGSMD